MIPAAFYSGYTKSHDLKYMTVLLPNGLWDSVYVASSRHNDEGVLNISGLVEFLMEILQPKLGTGWPGLYGDSIFSVHKKNKLRQKLF